MSATRRKEHASAISPGAPPHARDQRAQTRQKIGGASAAACALLRSSANAFMLNPTARQQPLFSCSPAVTSRHRRGARRAC
jgi:hypothetical protein